MSLEFSLKFEEKNKELVQAILTKTKLCYETESVSFDIDDEENILWININSMFTSFDYYLTYTVLTYLAVEYSVKEISPFTSEATPTFKDDEFQLFVVDSKKTNRDIKDNGLFSGLAVLKGDHTPTELAIEHILEEKKNTFFGKIFKVGILYEKNKAIKIFNKSIK